MNDNRASRQAAIEPSGEVRPAGFTSRRRDQHNRTRLFWV